MNFGLKSISKVASRNSEMLSNKNLKGKTPNLCFISDILLKLLALKFDFAYFSNFWAYSL